MENTQNQLILDYLQTHKKGITPLDAMRIFGCMRLSARIHDLRDKGYVISSEREVKKNRYGHITNFSRYKLEKRS